jgi:hypothetical protein
MACQELSNDAILQKVRAHLKSKGATGDTLAERLQLVARVTKTPLADVLAEPRRARSQLLAYFKSPLALHQHFSALATAAKLLADNRSTTGPQIQEWEHMRDETVAACNEQKVNVDALFAAATIDAKTKAGYVNQLMNMMATLNVLNLMVVLVSPSRFIVELSERCQSRYTEATYISRILSVFKYNPRLATLHSSAHQAWQKACASHRAMHLKTARSNAPTNTRQAQNFVPLGEWKHKYEELCSDADAHGTLDKSMTTLFMAYATCMPPKRAEVGAIHVYTTAPIAEETAITPNYIVLETCTMHVTKHKTSKHAVHANGITEQLSDAFMQTLRASLEKWPRRALFVDSKGQVLSNQSFSKWVIKTTRRIFGGDKAPGVSLLRHAFCTNLDYNKLTGLERDSIALRMGHTGQMQDAYRFLSLNAVSGSADNMAATA